MQWPNQGEKEFFIYRMQFPSVSRINCSWGSTFTLYFVLTAHDSAVHSALNGALYLRPNLETNGIARKLHFLLTLNSGKELAHSMSMYGCKTSSSVMLMVSFLCVRGPFRIICSKGYHFMQKVYIIKSLWCKFWVPNSTEKNSSEASF